jgi:hypothetical protein
MKRLLATVAAVVALVAPAKAQQATPEELAKMIAPESVAQLVARYAVYAGVCAGELPPHFKSFLEAESFIADGNLVRAAVARLPAQVAEIGGTVAWCRGVRAEVQRLEQNLEEVAADPDR